jgi:hypothetical protein
MCSVSFLPRDDGYDLAMNRDESRQRVAGLPPEIRVERQRRILAPSEPGGGTWIGVNEFANTLALVNWYSKKRTPASVPLSRGEVVRRLLPFESLQDLRIELMAFDLGPVQPFRLISVSCPEKNLTEWQWDGHKLEEVPCDWERHHWFSSAYDETQAERIRQATCDQVRALDSFSDLCCFHASHHPEPGPFSLCMHRPDASTVSFTGVSVRSAMAEMRYVAGPPCELNAPHLERRLVCRVR